MHFTRCMPFLSAFLLAAALFPIKSIDVEGLKRLTPSQVIAASGLRVGQKVEKADFEAAQARLLATGNLASVGYRYEAGPERKGYAVTFEVTEVEQVFPIRFEELPGTDAELLRVLAAADPLFTNPAPGTEPVIRRMEAALNAHLKVEPKVVGRVLADRPDEIMLLFRPNRPRPTVASVTFHGNKAFTSAELQNKMAGVAIGTLFTDSRFRDFLNNQIRPLYETRGLLRVAFPKIVAKKAEDALVEGVDIDVEVVEGDEYKLEKVTVSGVPNGAELLREAAFKEGQVFRLHEVVEGLERLRGSLRAKGYMRVTTDSTRTYNDEAKSVRMNVAVTPGPQFKMGRLTIKGLDIITEPEIRKMWGLEEGAVFQDGYPDKFLRHIREGGILDNLGETRAKLDYDEARGVIDVTVTFAGEKREPEKKRPF